MSNSRGSLLLVTILFVFLGGCNQDQTQTATDPPLLNSTEKSELKDIDANIKDADRAIKQIEKNEESTKSAAVAPALPRSDYDGGEPADGEDEIGDDQNPVAERIDRETGELADNLNQKAEKVLHPR